MGYGSRALQALNAYYSGEFFNLDEANEPEQMYPDPSIVEEVSYFLMFSAEEYACAHMPKSRLLCSRTNLLFER